MNQSIQAWLNQLIPIQQIAQMSNAVIGAFIVVGLFIATAGLVMTLVATQSVERSYMRAIIIVACMAISPLILTLAETIANGLVQAVGHAAPSLNWLIVTNPGADALTLDYTKPFQVLGKYLHGTITQEPAGTQWWEFGKHLDHIMRSAFITVCGIAAAVTVFIMEVMLILQKTIVVMSAPLMPVFVACLMLPSAHGVAEAFLKHLLGVLCWPISWALIHIGTMAVLQNLQAPSWAADLGTLCAATVILFLVCLCLVVMTLLGPAAIAATVVKGSNFHQPTVGAAASAAGQHLKRGLQTGGAVAGAVAGIYGGPAGVALGASMGSKLGGTAGMMVGAATESVEAVNGGRRAIPSSRSAGVADMAIAAIRKRAA